MYDLAENTAFEQILKDAIEKARKDSPTQMKYLTADGKAHYESADAFSKICPMGLYKTICWMGRTVRTRYALLLLLCVC